MVSRRYARFASAPISTAGWVFVNWVWRAAGDGQEQLRKGPLHDQVVLLTAIAGPPAKK
jgi:hypothetical protein